MVKKGTVKNIFVQLEDRQGGRKHLTKVTHVESFGFDPDVLGGEACTISGPFMPLYTPDLLRQLACAAMLATVLMFAAVELQKKFQTSSSVQRLPGKTETGKEIALQGNLLKVRPQMPWPAGRPVLNWH